MKKLFNLAAIIFSASIIFTGCNQNTIVIPKEKASTNIVYQTLNDAIISLANQLSKNNKLLKSDTGTITLTSFVDLAQLNKTSQFGRVVSESLFSELFIRGFNVTDFRGQHAISVNGTGEFFITRDISKLSSEVPNTYIVVGTYSRIDQNIIINARILDNKTGKIISSARAMYANEDCSIFGLCKNSGINSGRTIKIIKDDCGPYQSCNSCRSDVCSINK
jgi:TolB-like protein